MCRSLNLSCLAVNRIQSKIDYKPFLHTFSLRVGKMLLTGFIESAYAADIVILRNQERQINE